MSMFTDVFNGVSSTINEIFGEQCALYLINRYDETANLLLPSIQVIVDKSKQVKGEFNNVVGYRTAAKILRSDLSEAPKYTAYLEIADGTVYELGEIVEQSKTAFWLDCIITSVRFPTDLEPQPDFSFTIDNLVVDFTNNTPVVDPEIKSYTWDFGDTTSSTLINPQHVYDDVGDYTVTLTAISNTGYINVITKVISVV